MNFNTLKREFSLTARNVVDILSDEARGAFTPTPWAGKWQARKYMRLQKTA